jgi:hypothetical protein
MSAPVQIPPTIAMYEDEGDWTVRVGAQDNAKQIAQAVVPLLAGLGARKLLLITPFDTKVYKFDSASAATEKPREKPASVATPARKPVVFQDEGAPPSAEDASAEFERFVEEEAAAEKVRQEMERTAAADPQLPAEEEEEAPAKRGPGRPRKTEENIQPSGTVCGRCQGEGTIAGGGACPVCRGKGVIAKWGGRRR